MELGEFITKTLTEITKGVKDANGRENRFRLGGKVHADGSSGESVEFDIALETGHDSQKSGKGSVGISVIGAGVDVTSAENSQTNHRLKFQVFITEEAIKE